VFDHCLELQLLVALACYVPKHQQPSLDGRLDRNGLGGDDILRLVENQLNAGGVRPELATVGVRLWTAVRPRRQQLVGQLLVGTEPQQILAAG